MEDLPSIAMVLDKARKPSTKLLYFYKWRTFLTFAASQGLSIVLVLLDTLLTFLLHLFHLGLSHYTLKVYIYAIVTHQPPGSEASHLFSHLRFLRGLQNIFPPQRPHTQH